MLTVNGPAHVEVSTARSFNKILYLIFMQCLIFAKIYQQAFVYREETHGFLL